MHIRISYKEKPFKTISDFKKAEITCSVKVFVCQETVVVTIKIMSDCHIMRDTVTLIEGGIQLSVRKKN